MASAIEKALAAQYAGNGPMFMPSTPVSDLYAGIYPTTAPRTNPLAPSQGGSWPTYPQRPVSTALTPLNYAANVPPHDNSKRLPSGGLPFINYPPRSPIDITVGTAGAPQVASVPMPQPRPWNAPTQMDLAAIAAQGQPPTQMAYAQPPQSPAAVAAIAGLSPLTASQRINQAPTAPATSAQAKPWWQDAWSGLSGLFAGGQARGGNQPPAQRYAAANAQAAARARDNASRINGTSTAGYTYVNGKNVGYSAAEKADRDARGKATGDAIRKKAGPTRGADGRDLSFSPRSVQNSVRWQTGY